MRMEKAVLIVEDEMEQLNMLRQLVLSVNRLADIYAVQNAVEAYKILMGKTIDVFMVDIILDKERQGDTSGFQLIEKLRKIPKYMFTPVIIVSALEDPAFYAYTDLNCLGYIEKPFDPERIMKLLGKAFCYTTCRREDYAISFRKNGILYPVRVKEIVYLESINHVMHIHLSNRSCLKVPYKTCRQILREADGDSLVQCSRSTLVNRKYVLGVDIVNRLIIFKDNLGRADIGVTYLKKILAEFGEHC